MPVDDGQTDFAFVRIGAAGRVVLELPTILGVHDRRPATDVDGHTRGLQKQHCECQLALPPHESASVRLGVFPEPVVGLAPSAAVFARAISRHGDLSAHQAHRLQRLGGIPRELVMCPDETRISARERKKQLASWRFVFFGVIFASSRAIFPLASWFF